MYYYDFINQAESQVSPSSIKPRDNATTRMYTRLFLQRAMSVFDWTIPETWNRNYFLYTLYLAGYIAVIRSNTYGVVCQQCTWAEWDIYYSPAYVLVQNPLMTGGRGNGRYRIGQNCGFIQLRPDLGGLLDVCQFYAERVAIAYESASMNMLNSKDSTWFFAESEKAARTFQAAVDKTQAGNPIVVADKSLFDEDGKPRWTPYNPTLKNNYIASDVLDDIRQIVNDFDSYIGIPSANTTKRERLNTDEVNSNNVETDTLVDMWAETLQRGVDMTNRLFPELGLSFKKRYETVEGGVDNAGSISDNSGNV